MAVFVQGLIVRDIDSAVLPEWNAGLDSLAARGFAEPIGLTAAIDQKNRCRRQNLDQQSGSLVIAHQSMATGRPLPSQQHEPWSSILLSRVQ